MVKTEHKFAVRLKEDEDREVQDQIFVLLYVCPAYFISDTEKTYSKLHKCKIMC